MKQETSLVLWDWNGTLLDDVALCVTALNTLLARHGVNRAYDIAGYRAIFGFPIRDYYARAGFDFSKFSYELLAERYTEYYARESKVCPLNRQAIHVLDALAAKGIEQAVLSAGNKDTLRLQARERGVEDRFSALLGLDDYLAAGKTELGREYMRSRGIDPRTVVMVGDTLHDLETARAMGTRCVLYTGGHGDPDALRKAGVPVIDSLTGLENLLD